MEEFQLSKFTKEGAQLLRDVTEEFNSLGIDSSRLSKTFLDDMANQIGFRRSI